MTRGQYAFEHELARRFAERGYQTWVTPSEHDSVYVLLEKGERKTIIECVHYHSSTDPRYVESVMRAQTLDGYLGQGFTLIAEHKPDDKIHHFTLHVVHKQVSLAKVVSRLTRV